MAGDTRQWLFKHFCWVSSLRLVTSAYWSPVSFFDESESTTIFEFNFRERVESLILGIGETPGYRIYDSYQRMGDDT